MDCVYSCSTLNCNVLVLNKHYMALCVINVKRAISMLYHQQAEVVTCETGLYENYDFSSWCQISELKKTFEPDSHDWISTVSCYVAVPKIIRLLFYDRLPKKKIKLNRRNIFARDKSSCQYCGKKFNTTELSLDHVIPKILGGKSTWENLVCACTKCNSRKGGRTPAQARMSLVKKPVMPRRNPVIHLQLSHPRYQSWKQFLDNAYWSVELQE